MPDLQEFAHSRFVFSACNVCVFSFSLLAAPPALAIPMMFVIDKHGCGWATRLGAVAIFACNLMRYVNQQISVENFL
jgi:hypothetical protein